MLSSGKFFSLLVTRQLAVVALRCTGGCSVMNAHKWPNYDWPNYVELNNDQATSDQIVTDQIIVMHTLRGISSGYNVSNYWPKENPSRVRVMFYGPFVAKLFWMLGVCSIAKTIFQSYDYRKGQPSCTNHDLSLCF